MPQLFAYRRAAGRRLGGFTWHHERSVAAALVLVVVVALVSLGLVKGAPQAAAAADPVIAAAGDIACDPTSPSFNGGDGKNGVCQQKATYTVLTQINPTAVLPLGDNQYECGGYQAFVNSYALSWGKLLSRTYPVVGNHEYLTTGGTDCGSSAAGYFKYYASAAKVGTSGQGWYSFDVGTWHLIALNANCSNVGGCGPTSPQGKWLANDLSAHTKQCVLAYWHIPLNSSGGFTATNSYEFWKQLYSRGVDVILNGHAHIYERFSLQAPPAASTTNQGVSDPAHGIREFIVGTGGANHTPLSTPAPNSQVTNSTAFGVLRLTLHSGSYDWSFVSVAGQSFADSGTQTCHNTGSSGSPPSLVRQKTASGSGASLPVTLTASGAGHALVAIVALAAGSSTSVTSVSDSAGGSWTKGPVGFSTGTNSRVEMWYRLGAPSVSSVTVRLSGAKATAVNVSEWAGVASASAVDGSAAGSGASASSAATPSVATTYATDVVIGAINFPANVSSSLTAGPFKSLNDFPSSTSVHGRAAYLVSSATGSFKATWTLSGVSGGNGGAIIALRAG